MGQPIYYTLNNSYLNFNDILQIRLQDAFKSEFLFAFHVWNKEKPAKALVSETVSVASSKSSEDQDDENGDRKSQRSIALNILQASSSFLRLDKLVDKKEDS